MIVLPERVDTNWRLADGHRLVLDDLQRGSRRPPGPLVGAGSCGQMHPDPAVTHRRRTAALHLVVPVWSSCHHPWCEHCEEHPGDCVRDTQRGPEAEISLQRSHIAGARAGVAGKLVGRGEPGARTARAGDELGAESPGMPVILVIMMASCWARKPERWWRPVRRRAAGRAQALLGETGDQ